LIKLTLPLFVQAACWGLLASSGLLIGALLAVTLERRLSHRSIAAIMGFGGGVLIAVLALHLMESAFAQGGPIAATFGFLSGATAFSAINWRLAQHGARRRNRCEQDAQLAQGKSPDGARNLHGRAGLEKQPDRQQLRPQLRPAELPCARPGSSG
jgi:ZIP family zinc transporter